MTYQEALHLFEAARDQTDESAEQYLAAKNFGAMQTQLTAAVILADDYLVQRECDDRLHDIVAEANRAPIHDASLGAA